MQAELRFQISQKGKHNLVLHALSDSYAGIDQKVDIIFTALTEDEVKREVFIHPEDEELDLQPTLFQQLMGEMHQDEESDEEEEDLAGSKRKKKKGSAEANEDLANEEDAGNISDDSSDSEKEKGGKDEEPPEDSDSDSD